ncbi:MAG: LPS export ABC transporter periplasmic protein LptC [Muribaculum sp.]|nr:LPS export ABC transporter periplasmic protein LptC [Muribaculum sp.]
MLIALMVAGSCTERGISDKIDLNVDYDQTPTMTTTDVVTMISDSGYTRYRITSSLWLVFDQAKVPVWRFPDGLLLEKFDTAYNVDATVICDSATYFKNDQLWRLDGHVNIVNSIGEKFLTPQLFWSQRDNKIYSDSFIHIERADRTIEGYGFESNDRLTRYSVYNPTGIFPASDFQPGARQQATDSVATADTVADTPATARHKRDLTISNKATRADISSL